LKIYLEEGGIILISCVFVAQPKGTGNGLNARYYNGMILIHLNIQGFIPLSIFIGK
jgi:hypothetical protein